MNRLTFIIVTAAVFILSVPFCNAQTAENYVRTITMLDTSGTKSVTAIQYYDGLGNPVQTVQNGINDDMSVSNTTVQEYDGCGRLSKAWLPIAGCGVYFRQDVTKSALDSKAYSQTIYDAVDRPVFVSSPGTDMQGKGKRTEYTTNAANSVKRYNADDNGLSQNGYYPEGALYGEKTSDEDGHTVEVFKDLTGGVVLERRAGDNDTYYVYNNIHQLRFVLSPEYQNDEDLDLYAYEYAYDSRGNVIKKTLPQCEPVQYWYDSARRMTFMQDGRMRTKGVYRFYLYDNMSRVVAEGTTTTIDTKGEVINVSFNSGAEGILGTGYTTGGDAIELADAKLEIANYYDGYDFLILKCVREKSVFNKFNRIKDPASANGMLTGTLTSDTRGDILIDAYYYDIRGNVIKHGRTLAGETLLTEDTRYSFTGKPEMIISTLYKGDNVYTAHNESLYNCGDKLESENIGIGNSAMHNVSTILYDSLGRLGTLIYGSSSMVGPTKYTYDLRGWLRDITGKDFEEHMTYNAGTIGGPCFNGNISTQQWKTAGDTLMRGYRFAYDKLSRLIGSYYGEGKYFQRNGGNYDEVITGYTANGAIKGIQRKGLTQGGKYGYIDDLDITLNGNQLERVDDKAAPVLRSGAFDFFDNKIKTETEEYSYDENGALIYDANRGITNIEYSLRDNPLLIKFSDGSTTEYVYTAKGEKLRTIHHTSLRRVDVSENDPILCQHVPALEGSSNDFERMPNMYIDSTDYLKNFIFENGKIDKFLFSGGYYSYAVGHPARTGGDGGGYYYYLTDHLGNNRVVISEDGVIYQINHYYPFGAVYANTGMNPDFQKYKYTGKELDLTHGLNNYDHGARQNYSILGVWDRVDPMAEKYYNISSYAVCENNPILYHDLNGQKGVLHYLGTTLQKAGMVVFASGVTVTTIGIAVEIPSAGTSSVVAGGGIVITATGAAIYSLGRIMKASDGIQYSKRGSPNNNNGTQSNKKVKTRGQLQKEVEKGQAPKGIDRVDPKHSKGGQDHVHFKRGELSTKTEQ